MWSDICASSDAISPDRPCSTKSVTPLPWTASTGRPAVRASRAAIPKASSRAGET